MEITRTTIKGHEVAVIFTGKSYIFHSSYYGIIATADRAEDNEKQFTITTGNHHTTGGSRVNSCSIIAAVKRFVTKSENKFVPCKATFATQTKDLATAWLSISCNIKD